jgi:hypothetical protein
MSDVCLEKLDLSLLHTCIWEETLAELGCQYLAHFPIIPIHRNLYTHYDVDAQVYIPISNQNLCTFLANNLFKEINYHFYWKSNRNYNSLIWLQMISFIIDSKDRT